MNPLKGLSVITPLVSLFIQQSLPFSSPALLTHPFIHLSRKLVHRPSPIPPINLTSQGINDNPALSLFLFLARTNTTKIREKGQVFPYLLLTPSLSPPSSVRLAKSSINAHWTLENILRRRNKKPTGAKETEREKGTKERKREKRDWQGGGRKRQWVIRLAARYYVRVAERPVPLSPLKRVVPSPNPNVVADFCEVVRDAGGPLALSLLRSSSNTNANPFASSGEESKRSRPRKPNVVNNSRYV